MSGWQPITAPFDLVHGSQYTADLALSWLEKRVATVAMVAAKLTDAGFTNVVVQPGLDQASGTWGQADASSVSLPSEVTKVWVWVA